jgi:hypothetical protein
MEPGVSVSPVAALVPAKRARKLAALDAQLRQQGAVIEGLKATLRHQTERAEADERLLAEQAGLLVTLSLDLRRAVEQLLALVDEAAGGLMAASQEGGGAECGSR